MELGALWWGEGTKSVAQVLILWQTCCHTFCCDHRVLFYPTTCVFTAQVVLCPRFYACDPADIFHSFSRIKVAMRQTDFNRPSGILEWQSWVLITTQNLRDEWQHGTINNNNNALQNVNSEELDEKGVVKRGRNEREIISQSDHIKQKTDPNKRLSGIHFYFVSWYCTYITSLLLHPTAFDILLFL